ncbi:hypothetical protein MT356_09635 [Rathayibacter festucae]|uniref:hypothetical protein n=1 Tax=Rathayibacter festucae TaxID=110937 RepID=UPI001FB38EC2|nr:hypothetical protein [Rathayibacter festucae]MCJ1699982.1 hypothetical protein [Rathayibacter festucae]
MTDQLLDLLRSADAEPRTALSTAEVSRREALLVGILADEEAPAPRCFRRKDWAVAGAATLLLAAAAAAAVIIVAPGLIPGAGSTGLNGGVLASWTGVPERILPDSPLGSGASRWCESSLDGVNSEAGPIALSHLDARGEAASMLFRQGESVYYCLSAGSGGGFWEMAEATPAEPLSGDAVQVASSGSHGSGDAAVAYAFGFAGADVASVVLHEDGVAPIVATLEDGFWTAWWPVADDLGAGPSGTLTVTTGDGASREITIESLYRQ